MTVLRSGSATHVGRVRPVNQDVPLERSNLFAVADGMGGHVGGEVAARVAVETLEQAFERIPTAEGLREAFSDANTAVWRESLANEDLRGMGTTLTAIALVGDGDGKDVLALANVGDSRAYVFSGGQMVQVTADHSLAEERDAPRRNDRGRGGSAPAAAHPHPSPGRVLGRRNGHVGAPSPLGRPGPALFGRAVQRGGAPRDVSGAGRRGRPRRCRAAPGRRGQRQRRGRQHHRGHRRRPDRRGHGRRRCRGHTHRPDERPAHGDRAGGRRTRSHDVGPRRAR